MYTSNQTKGRSKKQLSDRNGRGEGKRASQREVSPEAGPMRSRSTGLEEEEQKEYKREMGRG